MTKEQRPTIVDTVRKRPMLTYEKIAELLGCCRDTVNNTMVAEGERRPRPRAAPPRMRKPDRKGRNGARCPARPHSDLSALILSQPAEHGAARRS